MFKPPTDSFEVKPLPYWGSSWPVGDLPKEAWQEDANRKKLYGIELAKNQKPFEAALVIFEDTKQALWVSVNWICDPIVIAARDTYAQTVNARAKLLDKDALSVKLLDLVDEKDPSGKFSIVDPKDKATYLKLYAEIQGFVGKTDTNINNIINNNKLELVLVPAPKKQVELVQEKVEEMPSKIVELPTNLKLVSAR